jgi:hypothetical protein
VLTHPEQAPWWWIGIGLVAGLAVTILTMVILFLVARADLAALDDEKVRSGDQQGLPSGASWKLNDSWASNLTALVAVLGTVLGLTDVTKAVLDKGDILVFALGNAVFLAVTGAAPALYTVFQRWLEPTEKDETKRWLVGTKVGLLVAAGVVVVGVTGVLFLLFTLLVVADLDAGIRTLGGVLLVVALATVVAYVVQTLRWQLKDARTKPGPADSTEPQGIVAYQPTDPGRPPARRYVTL